MNHPSQIIGLAFVVVTSMGLECGGSPVAGGPDQVAGDIRGVVTMDGVPRAGVTVTLRRGETSSTTITAGNGEYEFSDLSPGVFIVAIPDIAGIQCVNPATATVEAGEGTEVDFTCTTLQLEATGSVAGNVTVNGIGAGSIHVVLQEGMRRIRTTATDRYGAYQFSDVPTGPKSVALGLFEGQNICIKTRLEVDVTDDETTVADFECTGQVIEGRITLDGIGLPGAFVAVCDGENPWDYSCLSSFKTDSEGRYAYTSMYQNRIQLEPGTYFFFVQEIPEGTSCESPELPVSVAAGATVTVDIPCSTPARGAVSGRVTANGVSVPGMVVALRAGSRSGGAISTGDDGAYSFTNVIPGTVTVQIGAHEQDCPAIEREVAVAAGGTVVADFACTGQVVTGRVTVNGIPQSEVTVRLCHPHPFDSPPFCQEPKDVTDAAGRYVYTSLIRTSAVPTWLGDYQFEALWPGEYVVFVEALPVGATCPNLPVPVSVAGGGTVTADIPCVR